MIKKVGVLSLGCCRNLVDSEGILGRLESKGYKVTDINEAEVGIINTCAFINDSKAESIDGILDFIALKKQGKLKKIIVVGCLVQRYYKDLIKQFPEVDAFVGTLSLNCFPKRYSLTPNHFSYLKICESCINNCSYCIIPKIKQKFASIALEDIVKEAKTFDANKVKELNIVGQDISAYGIDLYKSFKLYDLVKNIVKETKNINWFRLLYLYPSRVTDDLLKLIRDQSRICKYLDIPIQHINNRVLKLMNRSVSKEQIENLIDRIRKIIPDCAIRTSLIVGFPTETEKEFQELLDFVQKVKFDRLGVFVYSKEEGTKAYSLPKQVSSKIKQQRFDTVMLAQQKIAEEVNKKFLGKELEVLIDEDNKDDNKGFVLGRTQYDAPDVDGVVYVKSVRKVKSGDLLKVKINDTLEYDLVGEEKI